MEGLPIKIAQQNPEYSQDIISYGTITEYTKKKNRTQIRVKLQEEDYLEDGIFYSSPYGNFVLTYEGHNPQERFDFYWFLGINPEEININSEINGQIERASEKHERNLEKLKNAVNLYTRHGTDRRARATIVESIDTLWPTLDKEITVYRGQRDPFRQEITTEPDTFFSTASSFSVSFDPSFFSFKDKCCIFILHIQPGIKYWNVGGSSTGWMEEEILIEGNGRFYQDRDKKIPGFRELSLDEIHERRLLSYLLAQNNNNNDLKNFSLKHFGAMTHTKNGKTVEQKSGVFEAYYFPLAPRQGGKRRKTQKNKQRRRRQTRQRR